MGAAWRTKAARRVRSEGIRHHRMCFSKYQDTECLRVVCVCMPKLIFCGCEIQSSGKRKPWRQWKPSKDRLEFRGESRCARTRLDICRRLSVRWHVVACSSWWEVTGD